jgi:hypothetical protein
MSGRHRKPADTSRTILRAGVVAAAVTAPLAITGSAMAAPAAKDAGDAKWDKLAKCESTNNWNANTGNGFKGGLQFTDSTWKEFGGKQYAPHPHQATREEQIAVAKRVQQEQGWNAWPTCTKKLGYA